MSFFDNPYEIEEVTVYDKKPTLKERQRGRKIKRFANKYKNHPDIVDAIYTEYENNPDADFNFNTPLYDKSRKYWNDAINSGIIDNHIYKTQSLYNKLNNYQPYANKFTYSNPAWAAWERQTENELKSLHDSGYGEASNYLYNVLQNYGPEAYKYAHTAIIDNIEKGFKTDKQLGYDAANNTRTGLNTVGKPLAISGLALASTPLLGKGLGYLVKPLLSGSAVSGTSTGGSGLSSASLFGTNLLPEYGIGSISIGPAGLVAFAPSLTLPGLTLATSDLVLPGLATAYGFDRLFKRPNAFDAANSNQQGNQQSGTKNNKRRSGKKQPLQQPELQTTNNDVENRISQIEQQLLQQLRQNNRRNNEPWWRKNRGKIGFGLGAATTWWLNNAYQQADSLEKKQKLDDLEKTSVGRGPGSVYGSVLVSRPQVNTTPNDSVYNIIPNDTNNSLEDILILYNTD